MLLESIASFSCDARIVWGLTAARDVPIEIADPYDIVIRCVSIA
jgi:hypothetical protein